MTWWSKSSRRTRQGDCPKWEAPSSAVGAKQQQPTRTACRWQLDLSQAEEWVIPSKQSTVRATDCLQKGRDS